MCLAQGPHRSDAGEARTRGRSVTSQALHHCAPYIIKIHIVFHDPLSPQGRDSLIVQLDFFLNKTKRAQEAK